MRMKSVIAAAAVALAFGIGGAKAQQVEKKDLKLAVGGKPLLYYLPLTVAERLRTHIADTLFKVTADVGEIPVTVSIGVAVGGRLGDTAEGLIRRADEALYEAKRAGRNCTVADPRANALLAP